MPVVQPAANGSAAAAPDSRTAGPRRPDNGRSPQQSAQPSGSSSSSGGRTANIEVPFGGGHVLEVGVGLLLLLALGWGWTACFLQSEVLWALCFRDIQSDWMLTR